jgi:DNA-directed RNA polymerase
VFAVPDAASISSAALWAEEKDREQHQRRLSEERAEAIRRNLLAAGRETATEYGRTLFGHYAQVVSDGLDALVGRLARGEAAAGPHFCALPVLLRFGERGVRPAASLALGAVLDQLSRRRPYREVARLIGRDIEDELRALVINGRDALLLRQVKRRTRGREAVSQRVMQELHCDQERWSLDDRFHVGGLLLDLVVASTGLVQVVQGPRKGQFVEPTRETLALIKANPPRPLPVRRLPMLVEPRPWLGVEEGGHLDSKQPLISSRSPIDLSYYASKELGTQLQVVNALQRQAMVLDPWMVEVQRQAWDSNIRGLFPMTRDPIRVPPQPDDGAGGGAWVEWRRQQAEAWHDEHENRAARLRIEESLRQCESAAGRPIWFAYDLDFRGRVYSSNRYVTHQGPDHEKGVVSFAQGEACGEEGFEWLLKGAAGHWGLGKAKWDERLAWGKQHLDLLTAIADDPLERLELWRGADDPWQLLQAAKAVRQWLEDPTQPLNCPVRFDQTCSGIGIAAALLRDQRLARHTNLIGGTRGDIYQAVADRATRMLRQEVELAGEVAGRMAAFWLDLGVDRAMCKAPVMTSVYGASHLTLVEGLVELLEERRGQVQLWQVRGDLLRPARAMAKVLRQALEEEIGPCLALQRWLRTLSKTVLSADKPIEWTTPMGWPMRLGAELSGTVSSGTTLAGLPRQLHRREEAVSHQLSARATNRGITANVCHSFDAALAHAIVCTAVVHGAQVLTNHDCFGVVPARAGWLHAELHRQLRELYKEDWLQLMTSEIRRRSRVKGIQKAPMVGDLCPGLVGSNPYCFS